MARRKFENEDIVVAKEACVVDVDGVPYAFKAKEQRIRADHPAVKAAPGLFESLEEAREAVQPVSIGTESA